jgi:queuine tRNA-ribosyltransferase
LRLALNHKKIFPWLRHGAADTLLHRGAWKSRFCPGLSWSLAKDEEPAKADLVLRTFPSTFEHEVPVIEVGAQ